MGRCSDFTGWVTATCKKCGKAFQIFDKFGDWNDLPPTKFYCPECEKSGFKNKKHKEAPEITFLKNNNITDKIVIKEFKKRIKRFQGKRLNYNNLLEEAIEASVYIKRNMEK